MNEQLITKIFLGVVVFLFSLFLYYAYKESRELNYKNKK